MQYRKVGLFGIFMVLIGHFSAATLSTTTTSLGCLGVYAIFALFRTAFSCGLASESIKSGLSRMLPLICMKLCCQHLHTLTHTHTQCKKVGRIGKSQTKLLLQLGGAACGFARRLVPLVNTQIQLNLIRLTCQRSLSVCVCEVRVCAQFVWHLLCSFAFSLAFILFVLIFSIVF